MDQVNQLTNALPDTNAHERAGWIEPAARVGYAAKGLVYAIVGGLAIRQAFGSGDVGGASEAFRQLAGSPVGKLLLAAIAAGLAGYVLWRLVQAILDPEADGSDDADVLRWGKRGFYLLSAGVYALLAYQAAMLVIGDGGGSGGSSQAWTARLMSVRWGIWLVALVGVGIVGRALLQFAKAWTRSFTEKIQAFELSPTQRRWVIGASRLGLVARGVIFTLIGSSLVQAALSDDPDEARGTEGALQMLIASPWLIGGIGVGLLAYAVYQWVKSRYRLVGLP